MLSEREQKTLRELEDQLAGRDLTQPAGVINTAQVGPQRRSTGPDGGVPTAVSAVSDWSVTPAVAPR